MVRQREVGTSGGSGESESRRGTRETETRTGHSGSLLTIDRVSIPVDFTPVPSSRKWGRRSYGQGGWWGSLEYGAGSRKKVGRVGEGTGRRNQGTETLSLGRPGVSVGKPKGAVGGTIHSGGLVVSEVGPCWMALSPSES